MRTRKLIAVPVVTAVALTFTGCGKDQKVTGPPEPPESRHCVDQNDTILPDSDCDSNRGGHWYYGGGVFPVSPGSQKQVVRNGSTTPKKSTVSRGGFGQPKASGSGSKSSGS